MKLQHYLCDVCGARESDPKPAATVRFPRSGEIHLCPEHASDVRAVIDGFLEDHEGKTMPPDYDPEEFGRVLDEEVKSRF